MDEYAKELLLKYRNTLRTKLLRKAESGQYVDETPPVDVKDATAKIIDLLFEFDERLSKLEEGK